MRQGTLNSRIEDEGTPPLLRGEHLPQRSPCLMAGIVAHLSSGGEATYSIALFLWAQDGRFGELFGQCE